VKPARQLLSVVLAVGVVAALPAVASAAPADGKTHHKAHSAGADAPPTIPSIVRVRITRGTAALARAADFVDQDLPNQAVASLLNARRNMYAAWRGAKYVIEHAPPPVAGDARAHKKAHSSGAAVVGTAYASPEETGMAVLGFQHDVATASYGLLDDAKGVLRDAVSTTMFAALNRRDSAIAYIHTIAPPPAEDASASKASVKAHASEAPPSWDTLMPGIVPDLDDEMQAIEGQVSGGALTPGEKRILNQADFQVFRTEQTINTYWPPVVGD
jgi:hypothetical protein